MTMIKNVVLLTTLISCCTLLKWLFPFATAIFLFFGVSIGFIFFPSNKKTLSTSIFNPISTTITTTTTTNNSVIPPAALPTALPTTLPTALPTSLPTDYEKLIFVKAEGAQLVGQNSYILNHPLSVVSHAVYNKFPVLPCEEVPELLAILSGPDNQITNTIVQRERVITSQNILPTAIISAMSLDDTTMVVERSEEHENKTLKLLTQNEDGVDFATLQVWEQFEQLENDTTKYTAETYLATPGLSWGLPYIVHSFACSQYASKSPLSKKILIRRCIEVENEMKSNDSSSSRGGVEVEELPLETPSKPA